jgi:hypothetical protein
MKTKRAFLSYLLLLFCSLKIHAENQEKLLSLIRQLDHSSWQNRQEATKLLIEASSEALPLLEKATESPILEIAWRARYILSFHQQEQLNPEEIQRLLPYFEKLYSFNHSQKKQAFLALEERGASLLPYLYNELKRVQKNAYKKQQIETLIQLLKNQEENPENLEIQKALNELENPATRPLALQRLKTIGYPARASILKYYQSREDPVLRQQLILLLNSIPQQQISSFQAHSKKIETLIKTLYTPQNASDSLEKLLEYGKALEPHLLQELSLYPPEQTKEIRQLLVDLYDATKEAKEDSDVRVKFYEKRIQTPIKALYNAATRRQAHQELKSIGESALPYLLSELEQCDHNDVQGILLSLISNIQKIEAITALVKWTEAPDNYLAQQAHLALQKLTNVRLSNRTKWTRWWEVNQKNFQFHPK